MNKLPTLLLTSALLSNLPLSGQTTDDIFAGLPDLQPTPLAPAPVTLQPPPDSPPADRETPALSLQPPESVTDAALLYTAGDAYTPPAHKPADPVDVNDYLRRGRKAWQEGRLTDAQQLFEAILFDFPYNKDATYWLRRIADKKAGREAKNFDTTRSRMLEQVQAAWNTPKPPGCRTEAPDSEQSAIDSAPEPNELSERLKSLRIPAISFQNADIQQVVLELSAILRKLDGKGVNLAAFGTESTLLPPITFSGTDLSALETLDIVTQMSGMKYEIGPNLVSLTPVNYEPPQQMVSTEFDILPAVGSKMMSMAQTGDSLPGPVDVRPFFSTVPFPEGSSARYNSEFDVLLVRNIPRHIDAIAALLDRCNRKATAEASQQVEIETKFIEVAQGTLEELGFEWTFGEAGTPLNDDVISIPGGQKLFTDTLRSGAGAFDSGISTAGRPSAFNSYASSVSDAVDSDLVGTAGELIVQKMTGTPVELVIQALERSAGSDLLSAPKILTKNGETASIHVGEIHWHPTAYDVVIERYAQPSLLPLDYEEQKTGVMLEVTPELDSASGTIHMKLAPEIRELAGYDEQHVGTIWPDYSDEDITVYRDVPEDDTAYTTALLDFLSLREANRTIDADRLIARQPVFKTRKVDTSVTIEDGSTIAMGGLIKEQLEHFKDSVPILGKIPLFGRLFRSEGEKSVKRNLLIFVTANQVNTAGHKRSAN